MIMLEVLMLVVSHDRRRKGTKPFPVLDASIEDVFHVGQSGMGNDRAVAKGTWPPFHAALKPSNNVPSGDMGGDLVQKCVPGEIASGQASGLQCRLDS